MCYKDNTKFLCAFYHNLSDIMAAIFFVRCILFIWECIFWTFEAGFFIVLYFFISFSLFHALYRSISLFLALYRFLPLFLALFCSISLFFSLCRILPLFLALYRFLLLLITPYRSSPLFLSKSGYGSGFGSIFDFGFISCLWSFVCLVVSLF